MVSLTIEKGEKIPQVTSTERVEGPKNTIAVFIMQRSPMLSDKHLRRQNWGLSEIWMVVKLQVTVGVSV